MARDPRRHRRRRTVVLTTHNIEEADALADRIVLLDHGRVIASGTPAEIKRNTAGSRITAVTGLATCAIGKLPGVTRVRRDARRTEIFASGPEAVVRALLAMDRDLKDLEVKRATLEEAFLSLSGPAPRSTPYEHEQSPCRLRRSGPRHAGRRGSDARGCQHRRAAVRMLDGRVGSLTLDPVRGGILVLGFSRESNPQAREWVLQLRAKSDGPEHQGVPLYNVVVLVGARASSVA